MPPRLRRLRVKFRKVTGAWQVRVFADGERDDADWRPWITNSGHPLFWKIFVPEEHDHLIDRPARLIIQPDDKCIPTATLADFPSEPWWTLEHGQQEGLALVDAGWSLEQLTGLLRDVVWNGNIAVLGSTAVHDHLRRHVSTKVTSGDVDDDLRESLVIVVGQLDEATQAKIQSRAARLRSALLVWLDGMPRSFVKLPEVTATGANRNGLEWLKRFYVALADGHEPPEALRASLADGPAVERTTRWLRDCTRTWSLSRAEPDGRPSLPPGWKSRLDRVFHEGHLSACLDAMTPERTVLVVVTHGDLAAGLDHFIHRPIEKSGLKIIRRPVDWGDPPSETGRELLSHFTASDSTDLARRVRAVSADPNERRIVWIAHGPAVLDEVPEHPNGYRSVTIEDLTAYIAFLRTVASELSRKKAGQLLVHIALSTKPSAADTLAALRSSRGPFKVMVLPRMESKMSIEDLKLWLDRYDLPYSDADVRTLESLGSYEAVVEWFEGRFPDARGLR